MLGKLDNTCKKSEKKKKKKRKYPILDQSEKKISSNELNI